MQSGLPLPEATKRMLLLLLLLELAVPAPYGVLRSRLPRCSCLAMAQQSNSKKPTIRMESKNAVAAIPICGSGHSTVAALFSCLLFDRYPLRSCSCFLCFGLSSKRGDTKPHVVLETNSEKVLSVCLSDR